MDGEVVAAAVVEMTITEAMAASVNAVEEDVAGEVVVEAEAVAEVAAVDEIRSKEVVDGVTAEEMVMAKMVRNMDLIKLSEYLYILFCSKR